ncbi:hypothetical protein PPL_08755 [Heterostelium album PN500]|uniref:BZIP domain-containing protein n=1 Tax=Heterostelium pallidum (strain ATCC 26659 / Pp 5 / PN500) TaxID=670386 RepID=D3BJM7_HETP5|nr:hypothetical protein PPL_08755 [Heterostelium album PN500]EFA78107.1 hypothetical protein PPL_08755 [Heterostelium album PN500]|eukprot:XP_020430234.1 hypothetical protein PPL_08755 [Heterostelium album PN500]
MIGRETPKKNTNLGSSPPLSYHPNSTLPIQYQPNINSYIQPLQIGQQTMHSIQAPPQPQRILPNQPPPQNTFHFNSFINPINIPSIKEEQLQNNQSTTSNNNNSNFHKFKLSNSVNTYIPPHQQQQQQQQSTSTNNLSSSGGLPIPPPPGSLHIGNNALGSTQLQPQQNSSTSTNTTPNTTSEYPTLFNSLLGGHSPNMVSGIFQSPSSSSSSLNAPPISPNSPQSPSSSNSSSMGSPNAILSSPTSTTTNTTNQLSQSQTLSNPNASNTTTPKVDANNNSPTKATKPKPNRSPSSIARRREQHREHERQRRLKQKQLLSSATEVRQENTSLLLKVAQLKNELIISQNSYAQMAQSYEDLMNTFNYVSYENSSLKKEIEHYKFGAPIAQQKLFPNNINPPAGSILVHSPPLPLVGPSISSLPHPVMYPQIKKEISLSPQANTTGTSTPNNNQQNTYGISPQQQQQLPNNLHMNQYGSLIPPPPPSNNKDQQPQQPNSNSYLWSTNGQTPNNSQFSPPPNFHSSHNYSTDHIQDKLMWAIICVTSLISSGIINCCVEYGGFLIRQTLSIY